jgi:predicted membrane-bound spermidine synthase
MDWLLIGIGVGLVPIGLAIWLPKQLQRQRRDRKIAVVLQAAGVLAVVGGSLWSIWLVPQLFMTVACVIASSLLNILSFFTLSLPCQTTTSISIAMAEGLVAFGVAFLTYGTTRRLVLAKLSGND